MIEIAKILVFPTLMIFAASSDLFTMTISNRISLLLVAGFCALALVIGMDMREIGYHFLAGVVVLVVSFGCYARGWIGGGDAKLAAATAVWFGFQWLLPYLLWASIFGGVLTVMILMFRRYPLPPHLFAQEWVYRLHQKNAGVPYGIALAAAALLVYPSTVWMAAASF